MADTPQKPMLFLSGLRRIVNSSKFQSAAAAAVTAVWLAAHAAGAADPAQRPGIWSKCIFAIAGIVSAAILGTAHEDANAPVPPIDPPAAPPVAAAQAAPPTAAARVAPATVPVVQTMLPAGAVSVPSPALPAGALYTVLMTPGPHLAGLVNPPVVPDPARVTPPPAAH